MKLQFKMTALALMLSVFPSLAIGGLLIDSNAQTLELANRELQISVIQQVANRIDSFHSAIVVELQGVSRALTRSDIDEQQRLTLALTMVDAAQHIERVAVYDAHGAYIDSFQSEGSSVTSEPTRLDKKLVEQAALRGYVFAPSPVSDHPWVACVVALRAGEKTTGFLRAQVPLKPVQQSIASLSSAHFSGVENPIIVLGENLRPALGTIDEELQAFALDLSELGLRPQSARSRIARSVEVDGMTRVATVIGLTSRPSWSVLVQVPTSVAYASLERLRLLVGVGVLGVVSVALLIGWLAARRICAPLEKLTRHAESLAHQDYRVRTGLDGKDEIGTLSRSLDKAAEEIEAREAKLKQEAAIRNDLGRYLSAPIVERIIERRQDMKLGGERREISVMFMDVVAFTPLAETLPPETVVQLLNELFTISTELIFRAGGMVDKFIGDCIMAVWGAPDDQEDHAERALTAADDILSWVETSNRRWREQYGVEIQLAVGINSGVAVLGNVGSDVRMEYTAIGDTVNVAARLESLARPNQILVGPRTAELSAQGFEFVRLDETVSGGRQQSLPIHEVLR